MRVPPGAGGLACLPADEGPTLSNGPLVTVRDARLPARCGAHVARGDFVRVMHSGVSSPVHARAETTGSQGVRQPHSVHAGSPYAASDWLPC